MRKTNAIRHNGDNDAGSNETAQTSVPTLPVNIGSLSSQTSVENPDKPGDNNADKKE